MEDRGSERKKDEERVSKWKRKKVRFKKEKTQQEDRGRERMG